VLDERLLVGIVAVECLDEVEVAQVDRAVARTRPRVVDVALGGTRLEARPVVVLDDPGAVLLVVPRRLEVELRDWGRGIPSRQDLPVGEEDKTT